MIDFSYVVKTREGKPMTIPDTEGSEPRSATLADGLASTSASHVASAAVLCDSSSQCRYRVNVSTTDNVRIATIGYYWKRGRTA